MPIPGGSIYTTSKYAVVGMSEVMKTDLARYDIGVSVLCPGGVITNVGKSGRNRPADLRRETDNTRLNLGKLSETVMDDILDRGNRCMLRLHRLPKPVIGSINGDAVGIGCSLALATDLRIAADTARLGVVFSRRGLGPDGGASYFLRNLVGPAKALELLYLGDLIDASEALRIGLVNRVVPEGELEKATFELAERLASGAPLAYRAAKAAVNEGAGLPLESVLDLEAHNQKVVGRSRDIREGIRAFLEKRKPEFRGE